MADDRKDLPPVTASNFLERVREVLSTYMGFRGDTLNRGATLRDLHDSGLVGLTPGWRPGGGNPITGPGSSVFDAIDTQYVIDLRVPPSPTWRNVAWSNSDSNYPAVTAGLTGILVRCDDQTYAQGHGHALTKVYGSYDGTMPNIGVVQPIMAYQSSIGSMITDPNTTWHLWMTWVSKDGVESLPSGPVTVTTGQDVSKLLEILNGEISADQLSISLNTKIEEIGKFEIDLGIFSGALDVLNTTVSDITNTPAYDNAKAYSAGELVSYQGSLYKAILSTTGHLPTNTMYWALVAQYASLADAVAGNTINVTNLALDIADQAIEIASHTLEIDNFALVIADQVSTTVGDLEYQAGLDALQSLGNKVVVFGNKIVIFIKNCKFKSINEIAIICLSTTNNRYFIFTNFKP
jgi:hypothetical protein